VVEAVRDIHQRPCQVLEVVRFEIVLRLLGDLPSKIEEHALSKT